MSDPLNDVALTTQDALDASSDWSHLTFTWEITQVKTSTSGGHARAVTQTYWKKTGIDSNSNSASFSGATPLSAEGVSSDAFVDFTALPEATVIGWIKDELGGSSHPNEVIQKGIDEQTNPVTEEQTLPWSA
jgi:hypothetical protein|tara:strand:- start:382 stop:777 length:396 start_codon:yes stop_codon:yes gene_type:complete